MKYIIEIENEPFGRNDDPFFPHGMDELYRAKGFKSLVFDQDGLDKLTPYTEPDRQVIEDEVWATAIKIDIASEDWNWHEMTYREAKVKYEEWKKQKDEIRVGDEVRYSDGDVINAVVIDESYENGYTVLTENGCVETHDGIVLIKTGRHFDEVEELLKKMREES